MLIPLSVKILWRLRRVLREAVRGMLPFVC